MNIGIITQPLSRNYGGILQNYALQQTLLKLGYIPYTFDLGKYTWYDWITRTGKSIVRMILGKSYFFPEIPTVRHIQEKPLRRFVDENISLIKPRLKRPTAKQVRAYDIETIIVGSDQVWRPAYNYDISDMFLGFTQSLNVRRIAYAVSFGTDDWEYNARQTNKCKVLAHKFDAISVREHSAVNICNKYLGAQATLVLDPTLLLTYKEYNKLINNIPQESKPTLFAYLLDVSEDKIMYVKTIAKKLGLSPRIKSAGNEISQTDSIEKWLANFRDAEFVITDSFHGTIFSIIFNKEFIVVGNQKRGMARFNSLLELFSLQNRLISGYNIDVYNKPIDWKYVNDVHLSLRQSSIGFLLKNLS